MRWTLALLLAASALAGCVADDDGDGTDPTGTATPTPTPAPTTTATGTQTGTPSPTPTPSPDPDRPPTATLSASVQAGTMNVTFDVDGADQDGDPLTWTLDADGDGETDADGNDLPATYTHTFDAAGNYTARLAVSDGQEEATAQVNVTLQAGGGKPGQSVEGTWLGGSFVVGCLGDIAGVPYSDGTEGVTHASFPVDAATIGFSYNVTITGDGMDSPGFAFLDADGGTIESGFLVDMGEGTVPDGAATGVFWTCAGANMVGDYASMPL